MQRNLYWRVIAHRYHTDSEIVFLLSCPVEDGKFEGLLAELDKIKGQLGGGWSYSSQSIARSTYESYLFVHEKQLDYIRGGDYAK